MKHPVRSLLLGFALLSAFSWAPVSSLAQGTAFTYQGRLERSGQPASGQYEIRAALYNAESNGVPQGGVLTNTAVSVASGLFTVSLDFGAQFQSGPRWLEMAVRTNGATEFSILSPRQLITPAPRAQFAHAASNLLGAVALAQLPAGVVTNNALGLNLTGSFGGSGTGLSNLNATTLNGLPASGFWKTNGNAGANPTNGAFLGTSDNQALELKVNGQRALRLEPNLNTPNLVAGSPANVVTNGLYGAVIAGGGSPAYPNRVGATYASVLGGAGNTASGSHAAALGNFTTASGYAGVALGYSTLAAGFGSFAGGNSARANHDGSFVWADHNFTDFASTTNNQFLIRAGGGVGINTNNPHGAALAVHGNLAVSGSFSVPNGNLVKSVNGMRDDVILAAGNGLVISNNTFSLGVGTVLFNDTPAQTCFKAITAPGNFVNRYGIWGVGGEDAGVFPSLPVGVLGEAHDGFGVFGSSRSTNQGAGVYGFGVGGTAGVIGYSGQGRGVAGLSAGSGSGIFGSNPSTAGHAGEFEGNVLVTGQIKFGSATRQMIDLWGGIYGIGVQGGTHYFRTGPSFADRFAWYQGGAHSDAGLDPGAGGTFLMSLDRNFLTLRGGGNEQPYLGGDGFGGDIEIGSRNPAIMTVGFWNSAANSHMDVVVRSLAQTSDRHAKQDFAPVDSAAILKKVASLPVSEWTFKGDDGTRHIGPMAQDFYAAFGTGADDKHIATVDADGVALAAIQGLNQKVEEKESRIHHLEKENTALQQRLDKLERLVQRLAEPKTAAE